MQDQQDGPVPAELQALAELQRSVDLVADVLMSLDDLVEEHRELSERLVKLNDFLAGEVAMSMDWKDRSLLQRQQALMTDLQFVTAARIQRFKAAP